MIHEVGIYRGSFDPPHLGHLEAVEASLKAGMDRVTVVYKDHNRFKPFRTCDKDRRQLIDLLFKDVKNVVISDDSFENIIQLDQDDPSVTKIHYIVGSDLFSHQRVNKNRDNKVAKVALFVIPRIGYPIPHNLTEWKGLPFSVYTAPLVNQSFSSTEVRSFFSERKEDEQNLPLPRTVTEKIRELGLYHLSYNAFNNRALIQKATKIIEDYIGRQGLFSADEYPLSLKVGNDIGLSGLSGDLVCFIHDNQQKIRLVVKIFQGAAFVQNFESELKGLQTISNLGLTTAITPKVLFQQKTDTFALIGMTFAPGQKLTSAMSEAGIRLCARACLELHLAKREVAVNLTDEQLAVFNDAVGKVQEKMVGVKLPPGFRTSDALEAQWKYLLTRFKRNPGYFSFTHGDPNPGNWIVDGNKVTFIDLSLFGRSMTADGKPNGFAANELLEASSSIWIVGERIGMSAGDIVSAQDMFKDEYMRHAPLDIFTPEALAYFNGYWILREVNTLLKKLKGASPADVPFLERKLVEKIHPFFS